MSAQPPETPAGRGSGDDPFSWLYQRGHKAPTEDVAPSVPPTVSNPAPTPAPQPAAAPPPSPPPAPPPSPPISTPPPQSPAAQPGPSSYAPTAFQPGVAAPYVARPDPPRRRGLLIGVVVALVVLAVVAGVLVAMMLNRSQSIVDFFPVTTPAPTPARNSIAPARPVASGVSADCTAPAATDDAGQPVTYDAANVLDGNRNTAWRCDGNGGGHTLTFSFPAGATLSKVGLINGYAKTDPTSGAKRYDEYRRITRVVWTFDNGRTVTQNLRDETQKAQLISVPPVATRRVVLTIERSTKPGRTARSRDAVLISDVTFR